MHSKIIKRMKPGMNIRFPLKSEYSIWTLRNAFASQSYSSVHICLDRSEMLRNLMTANSLPWKQS